MRQQRLTRAARDVTGGQRRRDFDARRLGRLLVQRRRRRRRQEGSEPGLVSQHLPIFSPPSANEVDDGAGEHDEQDEQEDADDGVQRRLVSLTGRPAVNAATGSRVEAVRRCIAFLTVAVA